MAFLRQFLIILAVSFLGEGLHALIPLPIPASVYGLALMLLALCAKLVRPEQVKGAASFLIEIMPVMFIPAAVGLLDIWGLLRPILVPAAVIIVTTTVLVMAVTGRTAQGILRATRKPGELAEEEAEGEAERHV
ncbi:CidA/LrgA family protein [Pseudoflavonifractor phocaeensis]|uniref:CidA/LrgA family protein n=1 Tax=Pseudoflavonifractor phocaeensis TaxID=1870988 RepID=UPI00313C6BDF